MRKHILNDLKHIVNTALYVSYIYYRSQWENVRGLNTSDANCKVSYKHVFRVLDIANGQSWLMLGSSVFTDLKISVDSLKSQGNLTSSTSGNPVNVFTMNSV